MTEHRDDVIARIRELRNANREVRQALVKSDRVLSKAIRHLESGSDIATTFEKAQSIGPRREVDSAFDAYRRRRHQLRLVIMQRGIGEGMSIGALSREWGFSRQLGARYAREARESSMTEPSGP
jgi:signal transduction histidine kinase